MGANNRGLERKELEKQGKRRCAICKKILPLSNFSPNSKKGKAQYYCRLCHRNRQRVWRENNRDRCNAYMKKYYRENKTKISIRGKCKVYGITKEEYLEIFRKQNGKCRICRVLHLELTRGLYVDHDHETGKVRGLLCNKCNWLLGNCGENTKILERAIQYIRSSYSMRTAV